MRWSSHLLTLQAIFLALLAAFPADAFGQTPRIEGATGGPGQAVAVAIVDQLGQPRLVLAHQIRSGTKSYWRYRTLDLGQIPSDRRRTFAMLRDGTALRFTGDTDAPGKPVFVDLTRRERIWHDASEADGTGKRSPSDMPSVIETRAIRLALLPDDPCTSVPVSTSPADRSLREPSLESLRRRCLRLLDPWITARAPRTDERPDWRPEADWGIVDTEANAALYMPAFQMAGAEEVFPGRVDTLPQLGDGQFAELFRSYLAEPRAKRIDDCSIYFHVSARNAGVWLFEYWLYFPFDYGGQGSHFHDSEHVFIEVDLLGGWVRRIMGAGHGDLAGNNIYDAVRPMTLPVDLPVMVTVELGKHATAPDIDRDFVFTPGLDENLYHERAKVWGVRDVIGDNNNHVIAYERTMSAPRLSKDVLGERELRSRYVNDPDISNAACTCRLLPLPATSPGEAPPDSCGDWKTTPTEACAREQVEGHADHLEPNRIFKNSIFPPNALRASVTMGPRSALKSVGLGLASDVSTWPYLSQYIKLPGRVALEAQWWWQRLSTKRDPQSCVLECRQDNGFGATIRYEQMLSNLFGSYLGLRYFRSDGAPSVVEEREGASRPDEIWVVFGSMIELPRSAYPKILRPFCLGTNCGLQAGAAFRQGSSPRYELRANLVWYRFAPKRLGIRP